MFKVIASHNGQEFSLVQAAGKTGHLVGEADMELLAFTFAVEETCRIGDPRDRARAQMTFASRAVSAGLKPYATTMFEYAKAAIRLMSSGDERDLELRCLAFGQRHNDAKKAEETIGLIENDELKTLAYSDFQLAIHISKLCDDVVNIIFTYIGYRKTLKIFLQAARRFLSRIEKSIRSKIVWKQFCREKGIELKTVVKSADEQITVTFESTCVGNNGDERVLTVPTMKDHSIWETAFKAIVIERQLPVVLLLGAIKWEPSMLNHALKPIARFLSLKNDRVAQFVVVERLEKIADQFYRLKQDTLVDKSKKPTRVENEKRYHRYLMILLKLGCVSYVIGKLAVLEAEGWSFVSEVAREALSLSIEDENLFKSAQSVCLDLYFQEPKAKAQFQVYCAQLLSPFWTPIERSLPNAVQYINFDRHFGGAIGFTLHHIKNKTKKAPVATLLQCQLERTKNQLEKRRKQEELQQAADVMAIFNEERQVGLTGPTTQSEHELEFDL